MEQDLQRIGAGGAGHKLRPSVGVIGGRIESPKTNVTRRGKTEVPSSAVVWLPKASFPLRLMFSSVGSSARSHPPIRCQRFLSLFERGKADHRCVGLSFRFNPSQLSIPKSLYERYGHRTPTHRTRFRLRKSPCTKASDWPKN